MNWASEMCRAPIRQAIVGGSLLVIKPGGDPLKLVGSCWFRRLKDFSADVSC
jgi:hypothetical protein